MRLTPCYVEVLSRHPEPIMHECIGAVFVRRATAR